MKQKLQGVAVFFVVSLLVLQPQIAQHAIILGDDSLFHFSRFFDTAQQFKYHNFQYFISTYGFSESARIVNALYGPYLAYFFGFILYITQSWFLFQIITDFLVLFLSGISMYYLLIKNKINHNYALFLSSMYMLSFGVTAWVTNQQFISWGAVLIPLGISVATRMISNKNAPVNIFEMSFAITLMVQTHVLSALILVIIMCVFFILSLFIVHDKKKLLITTIISALITIILTSNVWGAMFEVYASNSPLRPFINPYPLSAGSIDFLSDDRIFWTFSVLYTLQIIFVIYYWKKITFVNKSVTLIGFALLLLTFPILPWNFIFAKMPFISILQFPFRLLPFAEVLLLLGISLTLNSIVFKKVQPDLKKISNIIMILIVVLTLSSTQSKVYQQSKVWHSSSNIIAKRTNVSNILNGDQLREVFLDKNIGKIFKYIWKPTPDYLPVQNNAIIKHPYNQYNQEISKKKSINKLVTDNVLNIKWTSNVSNYYNTGIVKYHNTRVVLNGHSIRNDEFYLTDIGTLMVKSHVGQNHMTVSYTPSSIFNILFFINILAWIIFLLAFISKSMFMLPNNIFKIKNFTNK